MRSFPISHLKALKRLSFGLMLLAFIPQLALADNVCLPENETADVVVQLENYDKQVEMIALLKEENVELEKKISNLLQIQKIQEEQLIVSEDTIKALQGLNKVQKESYEKALKEAKPSFLDKAGYAIGGAGIGVLLSLILFI